MRIRSIYAGLLAATLFLAAACTTIPAGSDRYSGANFDAYRTYAWISNDPLVKLAGTQQDVSALTVRRLREAIEAELSAKNYKKVDAAAQADFVVAFSVGTRDRLDAQSYPLPYRGPWEWESHHNDVEVNTYVEGTLSVDVFDGASKQPVWHGWATKVITNEDKSNPAPVIQRAVSTILAPFPARHN
ncbi:MAG TPA: DUF4136 domain-containing protein [Steroidobacteraceae bacterium]|nr:DUF4136 domain-containing protein [Steroidobacteraceae bacterium]